ncbi:MAG: hypothetical protein ABR887_03160 [Methanoregulaceae archaeon]|jgi:hypothetical protein
MKSLHSICQQKLVVIGLFVFILSLSLPVSAGLTVIGSKYMNTVSPGDTVIHTMTIETLTTDPPMGVTVDVMGFGQAIDSGYIALDPKDDTSPYSARTFITLDSNNFQLTPGDKKVVTATITVPKNIGSGGRYAIIYVSSSPFASGGSTGFVTAYNVPIMLTLAGPGVTQTGSITDLNIGAIDPGQPILITTTFKNTGNVHYYNTLNEVRVTGSGGKEIAVVSKGPIPVAVIPSYTVNYKVILEKALPPGTYTVASKVSLQDGTILDTKTTSLEIKSSYVAPSQEVDITLTPNKPSILSSSDGRFTINFPAGAVLSNVNVALKPITKDQLPAAPESAKLGSTCFQVDGLSGLLSKEAKVQVKYSSADLDAAGGDASKLVLSRYDESDGKWTLLKTDVDKGAMILSTTTNRFSIWTVMVSSGGSAVSGQSNGFLGLGLGVEPVVIIGALGLFVIAVGIRRKN